VPAQGPELAIHHSDAVLAAMNEWSERQHGASGLTQRCRESAVSMRDAEDQARSPACVLWCTPVASRREGHACRRLLRAAAELCTGSWSKWAFLRGVPSRGGGSWGRWRAALAARQVLAFVAAHTAAGAAQLAGNSVHVDAAFLRRRMPRLAAHMHHRIVDVSTVMELCRRWYPRAFYRAPKMQVRAALATARRRARMRPAVRLLVSCFRVLVHRQRLVLLAPRLPWKPECLVLVRHASTGHGATQCEFRARACADVVVRACRRLRTRRGQTSARAWSSCGTTESTCSGGRPDAARSALHLCCAVLSCLTETAPCMTRVRGPTLQLCRVAQRACHYSGAAPVQATPSRRARQDTLPSHPPRCAVGTSPLSSQPHRLQ